MSHSRKTTDQAAEPSVKDRIPDRFYDESFDDTVPVTTVEALFQRHIGAFSGIPGQISEFRISEQGFEWRCEYDLGVTAGTQSASGGTFMLLFSLIDLPNHRLPSAVLYLLRHAGPGSKSDRHSLPLEDLAETLEILNDHLMRDDATIGMLANADCFITALGVMRQRLTGQLVWD